MKKLLSCVIIGIVVMSGLGAAVTVTEGNKKISKTSSSSTLPYIDELDQSMVDMDGTLPVGYAILGNYTNLTVAQSFIPQMELLTRVQFLMAANVSTTEPCVLAIRENLTEENLAVISLQPDDFPIVNGTPTKEQLEWIDFNIDDLWVVPGQTYFIVVYSTDIVGNFYWIAGNGTNMYPNGSVFISVDNGNTWGEFVTSDGCFKTYGLHETFLQITIKGGFGPSLVIKNIGNHTAWDVIIDTTTAGGFILIGEHFTLNITELPPSQEITLKPGFIVGFGKITISFAITGANVKEMSSEVNGLLLLFFLIGIK